MNKYYQMVGEIDGSVEQLWGSFIRSEVVNELQDERASLKAEGYRKLRIESTLTNESPDPEVYS